MLRIFVFFRNLYILFPFFTSVVIAQFNTNAYKDFLQANKNISPAQLLQMYPSGLFNKTANVKWNDALYHDSVEIKLKLTDYEKQLLNKNGFVVTERLQADSYGKQFADIYHKDLPVYISSDAILHAFHASYDKILKNTELNVLIKDVKNLLETLHNKIPELSEKYSADTAMTRMLKDVDIYLTVPLQLLGNIVQPYFSENISTVNTLLEKINTYNFVEMPLFSIQNRKLDFSQFKPRGHYDDENYPELAQYFKAMMWLGRTELYLIAPRNVFPKVPFEDVQRQVIDATLISELIDLADANELYNEIEFIIKTFVGEQDNVTLNELNSVLANINITNPVEFLDSLRVEEFQDTLVTKEFAEQKILSQILIRDPMKPDSIMPASAFMLFGQRFVIDSYVTGSVVYDRIKALRMLPSTLDILFALGNNATAQLLQKELEKYNYSKNLTALRYLIDSYDFTFWENSIYNLWLNSIRKLNPPNDRSTLPAFMQTAAWWQQKLNSQLASWTELRHDNLLYVKQSYTGGLTCSYPYSYVEPVPEFFNSMSILAKNTMRKLDSIPSFEAHVKEGFDLYFNKFSQVADTLAIIAQKELDKIKLSDDEKKFLKRMLFNNPDHMCGAPDHIGWYPDLFYQDYEQENLFKKDFLVADIHTSPYNEYAELVGWVKHSGTGPIDLSIIVAPVGVDQNVAFVGPVASYYEYTSTNFLRLTDNEWKESYLDKSTRPEWVNIYLADKTGNSRGKVISLLTNVKENKNKKTLQNNYITARNYPNPFNPTTVISFNVPSGLSGKRATLTVYNIQGKTVKILLDAKLQSGTYLTRWNGTNESNIPVASGVYFYEVRIGEQKYVGKMNLMK